MTPEHLERALTELGADVRWPATPDVAPAVRAGIAAPGPRAPARRRRRRRAVAIGGLAAAVVAGAVVSPVGAGVRRLLGLAGGERIERVTTVPAVRGGPPPARLDLGRRVTLEQARRLAGFAVVVPAARVARPQEIRLGGALGPRSVSLVLGADAVLTETPGSATLGATKLLGAGTPVRRVPIGGAEGLWIGRGPRLLRIFDRRMRPVTWRSALPGSGVLLWDRDGVALRLETRRPLAEALRIARSVG